MAINVSPGSFNFTGAGQTVVVTIQAHVFGLTPGEWRFARVNFTEASASAPDAHFPVAVTSTCAVPDAPAVTITASNSDVVLSWNDTGATAYEAWRSTTPYFTPYDAGSQLRTPPNHTALTFTDADVIGDTNPNYYYKVVARNSCGAGSSDTANHTAAFSCALVPGTP
jgi:hypothetical protein